MKNQTESQFVKQQLAIKENALGTWWLSGQTVAGATCIAVAAALLLSQYGVLALGGLWQWTPLLILPFALWQLASNGFRHWLGPALMVAIALVVQLRLLGVIDSGVVAVLWPLLLIGAGVLILTRHGRQSTAHLFAEKPSSDSGFDILAIFGGAGRLVTTQAFSGGRVTIAFGGAEIDLRQMQVAEPPAIIDVIVLFGGINIKASPDTVIATELVAVFGGSGDDRNQRKMLPGEQPEIIVRGVALFGGLGIEA